jgi:HPt (histidine-containing phosphotransfer) domain-containing protein
MIIRHVDGLDMQEAVLRFGSEETFFEVLRSYAVNTPPLLEQMRNPTEAKLADYAVIAHGIKGSSYTVGAGPLGDMAKDLEHAATGKDWPKVRDSIPPLLETAEDLLRRIDALLLEAMPAGTAEEDKPLKPAPDPGELAALYRASLSCSHSAMENYLQKLEQYRYQSGGDLVAWLRGRVDAFDYALINERLAERFPQI